MPVKRTEPYPELTEEQSGLVLDNLRLAWSFANSVKRKNGFLDIEDIVAYAYIGLVGAARGYHRTKRIEFSTFAMRCMRNVIVRDLLKKEYRYQQLIACSVEDIAVGSKEDGLSFLDTLECSEPGPSEYLMSSLLQEEIQKVVPYLTSKEREIYNRLLRGDEVIQIARELGKSKQGVYAHVANIKKKLNAQNQKY